LVGFLVVFLVVGAAVGGWVVGPGGWVVGPDGWVVVPGGWVVGPVVVGFGGGGVAPPEQRLAQVTPPSTTHAWLVGSQIALAVVSLPVQVYVTWVPAVSVLPSQLLVAPLGTAGGSEVHCVRHVPSRFASKLLLQPQVPFKPEP